MIVSSPSARKRLVLAALCVAAAACEARPLRADAGTLEDAPPVGSERGMRVIKITVQGTPSVLGSLQIAAPGIRTSELSNEVDSVAFVQTLASWDQGIEFVGLPLREPSLSISPWLCRETAEAESALDAGATATEEHTIEVDQDGRMWTSGRLGQGFWSRCSWSTSNRSAQGVDTLQDGPCRCDEPQRRLTNVELLRWNNLVSTPDTCFATFGSSDRNVISVNLARAAHDDVAGISFTLSLVHCKGSNEDFPIEVVARSNSTGCADEGMSLTMGAGGGGRPRIFSASSGSWRISASSPDRGSTHVSEIDLTFETPAGDVYVANGKIELPQISY